MSFDSNSTEQSATVSTSDSTSSVGGSDSDIDGMTDSISQKCSIDIGSLQEQLDDSKKEIRALKLSCKMYKAREGLWLSKLHKANQKITRLKKKNMAFAKVTDDFRKEVKSLKDQLDAKKKLEERVSQLESEPYLLNENLKTLEAPQASTSKSAQNSSNSIVSKKLKEEKRTSFSPILESVGLMRKVRKRNRESGFVGKDTRKINIDSTEKYSIFKKPRLGLLPANTAGNSLAGGLRNCTVRICKMQGK